MSNVYRKTERGQTEIATRQYKLAPRLRSALVVVDGKRSQFELASMIAGEPQETLQALLAAGFIELTDAASPPQMPFGPGGLAADLPVLDVLEEDLADDEAATGYAPTQPLEQFPAAPAPAVVAPRPAMPAMPAVAAHNLDSTKRHAMQWLSQQLGPYAEGANRRIERCDTAEALGSAILVARSVVEQQLGAQAANTFEAEMFAALRRGAAG